MSAEVTDQPDTSGEEEGTCPYCGAVHRHDFGGRLVWVVKRTGTSTQQ